MYPRVHTSITLVVASTAAAVTSDSYANRPLDLTITNTSDCSDNLAQYYYDEEYFPANIWHEFPEPLSGLTTRHSPPARRFLFYG